MPLLITVRLGLGTLVIPKARENLVEKDMLVITTVERI